jgi:hypothetical protein
MVVWRGLFYTAGESRVSLLFASPGWDWRDWRGCTFLPITPRHTIEGIVVAIGGEIGCLSPDCRFMFRRWRLVRKVVGKCQSSLHSERVIQLLGRSNLSTQPLKVNGIDFPTLTLI